MAATDIIHIIFIFFLHFNQNLPSKLRLIHRFGPNRNVWEPRALKRRKAGHSSRVLEQIAFIHLK